jgi:hypothetical protein
MSATARTFPTETFVGDKAADKPHDRIVKPVVGDKAADKPHDLLTIFTVRPNNTGQRMPPLPCHRGVQWGASLTFSFGSCKCVCPFAPRLHISDVGSVAHLPVILRPDVLPSVRAVQPALPLCLRLHGLNDGFSVPERSSAGQQSSGVWVWRHLADGILKLSKRDGEPVQSRTKALLDNGRGACGRIHG